jgi:hypothetical protein
MRNNPWKGEKMSELTLDVELAARIKEEMKRKDACWINEDLRRLCEGSILPDIWKVLNGKARIIECDDTLIDCDIDPSIPSWYSIESHERGGLFSWDPKKVGLHVLTIPEKKGATFGEMFLAELADKLILNGNVRDYLIQRKYLIPKEWKGCTVVFPGSIYRCELNRLCVPGLEFIYGHWADTEARFCWDAKDSLGKKYAFAIHQK